MSSSFENVLENSACTFKDYFIFFLIILVFLLSIPFLPIIPFLYISYLSFYGKYGIVNKFKEIKNHFKKNILLYYYG